MKNWKIKIGSDKKINLFDTEKQILKTENCTQKHHIVVLPKQSQRARLLAVQTFNLPTHITVNATQISVNNNRQAPPYWAAEKSQFALYQHHYEWCGLTISLVKDSQDTVRNICSLFWVLLLNSGILHRQKQCIGDNGFVEYEIFSYPKPQIFYKNPEFNKD